MVKPIYKSNLPFGRPPDAVAVPGTTHLFTLPHLPGILCKDVANHKELEHTSQAVGYYAATCPERSVQIFFGEHAQHQTPWPMFRSSSSNAQPARLFNFIDDNTNNKVMFNWKTANARYVELRDTMGIPNGGNTADRGCFFAPRTKQQINTYGVNTGSALLPATHRFAVVNRADYGVLFTYGSGGTSAGYNNIKAQGFLTTKLFVGKAKRLIVDNLAALTLGADEDTAAAITQAVTEFAAAGTFDVDLYIGVTTSYNQDQSSFLQTGFALTAPDAAYSGTYGRNVNLVTGVVISDDWGGDNISVPTLTRSAPLDGTEVGVPKLLIDVNRYEGIPLDLIRDIATWHKMGSLMNTTLDTFNRATAGVSVASPWSTYFAKTDLSYDVDPDYERQKATLSVAATPSAAGFVSAMDDGDLLRAMSGNCVTGNWYYALRTFNRMIYGRAEEIIRNK